jgi:hypothetical protein
MDANAIARQLLQLVRIAWLARACLDVVTTLAKLPHELEADASVRTCDQGPHGRTMQPDARRSKYRERAISRRRSDRVVTSCTYCARRIAAMR